MRDEYDKLENLLRVKGIDPDEFLNQKTNNHGDDDDGDENDLSDCSECSCEECCSEENQSEERSDETSSDQGKNEASTSCVQQASSSKVSADEHNKRAGKDRLNVN